MYDFFKNTKKKESKGGGGKGATIKLFWECNLGEKRKYKIRKTRNLRFRYSRVHQYRDTPIPSLQRA